MRPTQPHGYSAWCQAVKLSEQILCDTCDFTNHPLAFKIESTALRLTQVLGDCCSAGTEVQDSVATSIEQLGISLKIELELAGRYGQMTQEMLGRLLDQLQTIGHDLGFEKLQTTPPRAIAAT